MTSAPGVQIFVVGLSVVWLSYFAAVAWRAARTRVSDVIADALKQDEPEEDEPSGAFMLFPHAK